MSINCIYWEVHLLKGNLFKKGIILTVIILFLGVSAVQGINNSVETARDIGETGFDIITLYPTDDVYIDHQKPKKNFNGNDKLILRNEYGYSGSSGWACDILIKFDLSSLPSDILIEYAHLKLYLYRW